MKRYSNDNKTLKSYTFIDLFCGIGGFHIALSSLGAKCVFASDINNKACEVYEKNFRIKPCGDITKIKNEKIPTHDILCGGFPCQPFSISGNKQGFKDPNGKLFFQIIRIAKYHKPKVIFLENVKNLQGHNGGKTLKTIKEELKKIGYRPFESVLNASDFGVPQARKRIYIVAFRSDLEIDEFKFPEPIKKTTSVKDILVESVDPKYVIKRNDITLKDDTQHKKERRLIRIGSIGPGRQGERIYSIYGQAITLSSQGGGPGGKTGIYKVDDTVRILTPRECARVMGFPNRYKLSESDSDAYKQFGNSVVVNVIQEIGFAVGKCLEGGNNGKSKI